MRTAIYFQAENNFPWTDKRVLYEGEARNFAELVVQAVKRHVNLSGADLCHAVLNSTNLRGAILRGANLYGAILSFADLRDADLRGVHLRHADLLHTDLRGAKIPWHSHDMLAELLGRAAGKDIDKRKVAGLILMSRDWYCEELFRLSDPLMNWALDTLVEYATNDPDAPAEVKAHIKSPHEQQTPQASSASRVEEARP